MTDFLIYALKSILALGLFALVYRLFLMNDGNFQIRRIYLLISVVLATTLPLFKFTFFVGNTAIPSVLLDEIVIYSNGIRLIKETSTFPVKDYLQILYFMISGFFLLRIAYNITILLIKASKDNHDRKENVKLFIIKDKNISFSFFRNVFIGQTSDEEEQERIFAHERVHALQLHSIDVLYIEILTGLLWFNPMIWWYRNEIKNVHEYLADQGALETGFNKKEYQITLLEHLIGSASISITNSFNYSLIKNRIAMMNKEKMGRKNIWKIFILLPASIIIALAFACTEKSPATNAEKSESMTAYYKAEQMPVFPGGMEALSKFIATNLTYPAEAIENKVQGTVYVQFIVDKDGKIVNGTKDFTILDEESKETVTAREVVVVAYKPVEGSPTENTEMYVELLKKEAKRVISILPVFEKPGMNNGKNVAVAFTIPINFVLQ